METKQPPPKDIDDYIGRYSPEIQEILERIRAIVRESAPDAEEAIAYQMPTFRLNGNLVHFAAFKNHIGFYPTPTGIEAFQPEISKYEGAKGSVQFPLNQPIPYDLIRRIVAFRVEENRGKMAKKGKKAR